MADIPAKRPFLSRSLMLRIAWILLVASLIIPASSVAPVAFSFNLSAMYVYGLALGWSTSAPGGPGSLGFVQAVVVSLALFSCIGFLYSIYLGGIGRLNTQWKGLAIAFLIADASVALLVPELARLPAYWVWLASMISLSLAYLAFGDNGVPAAEQARLSAVIDRGEVPAFVWCVLGFTLLWIVVSAITHANAPKGDASGRPIITYLTDTAKVLTADEAAKLTAMLQKFEGTTPAQVAVAIYPSVPPGKSLEQFTIETAERTPLGFKGYDTGAFLFVFMAEHTARLEVGYGLEGTLTDVDSRRILESQLAPAFARGEMYPGLDASLKAVFAKIDEAITRDGAPSLTDVWRRKLRGKQSTTFGSVLKGLGVAPILPRIGGTLVGAFFAAMLWSKLALWVQLARDRKRSVNTNRTRKKFVESLDFLNPEVLGNSVQFFAWGIGALIPAVGIVIIAGGGTFGGAGAMMHW